MKTIRANRAKLYLLSSEEGGRTLPVRSGYFAGVYLRPEQPRDGNDGFLVVEGGDLCHPGDECTVQITFFCPEYVQDVLKLGARFQLQEGSVAIGRGTIIELLEEGAPGMSTPPPC